MALHNRLPHIRNPRHHRIAREIGLNGRNRGVLDVSRSGKMRLAGTKIHQVRALRTQLGSLGGHSHGCRNLNTANPVGKYFRRSSNCHDASIFTDFVVCIQWPLKYWRFCGVPIPFGH